MTAKKKPVESKSTVNQPVAKKPVAKKRPTPARSDVCAPSPRPSFDRLAESSAPAAPSDLGGLFAASLDGFLQGINESMTTLAQLEIHRREQYSAQRQREHEFHLAALKAVAEAARR